MPLLNIVSNVPKVRVSHVDTMKKLSKAVSNTVGKPENWIMVSLNLEKPVIFAGTDEPCAFGEITNIGDMDNKKVSLAISTILEEELSIKPSRFYLKFTNVAASDMGWNGSTF